MSKLIITRGLPGCGKTTWARKWVANNPVHRARVNRDDLRAMAHNSMFIKGSADHAGTERAIIATRDAAISSLLRQGVAVVCDDTNLPSRSARELRRLATLAGASFEVVDMTDVPLSVCIDRDAAREGHGRVGETTIRDMWLRYVKGRPFPLALPDEPAGPGTAEPYDPPVDAPTAVMVDLDGTTALMCNRSPYDSVRVGEDRPNPAVISTVWALYRAGHHIIFCSGRTEEAREATQEWLRVHVGVPYTALLMRPTGDGRKDSIVKRELFDKHIRKEYDVVVVLDDRDQVVEMWRSLGLPVFQVAKGDF